MISTHVAELAGQISQLLIARAMTEVPHFSEQIPLLRRYCMSIRRPALAAIALVAVTGLAAGCGGGTVPAGSGTPASSGPAHRGGTLTLLGQSDIFNLDPVSAHYTVSTMLERMFARQLFTYPSVASWNGQITVVPDIATEIPTAANGGITGNGTTYTIHLKQGVDWNTTPARRQAGDPADGRAGHRPARAGPAGPRPVRQLPVAAAARGPRLFLLQQRAGHLAAGQPGPGERLAGGRRGGDLAGDRCRDRRAGGDQATFAGRPVRDRGRARLFTR